MSRTPRHIRGCIICSKLHPSARRERFYASVRLQGGHSVHPGGGRWTTYTCTGVRVFILPDGPQSRCGELSFPRCRRHSPKYASAHTLRGYYYYYYYYCITSASVLWVGTMRAKIREKAHKYAFGQPDGKTPLGRPKFTWKKDYWSWQQQQSGLWSKPEENSCEHSVEPWGLLKGRGFLG